MVHQVAAEGPPLYMKTSYGRWKVLQPAGPNHWLCRCSCGAQRRVAATSLNSGASRSCGCLRKEIMAATKSKHRMVGHRLYWVWAQMLQRCSNPKYAGYDNYGGRGIKVCDKWHDALTFLSWAIKGWKPGLTLDRADNDGDYSPTNCIWSSRKDQARNQRRTVLCAWEGRRVSILEASEKSGVPYRKILSRRRRGWPEERWLS